MKTMSGSTRSRRVLELLLVANIEEAVDVRLLRVFDERLEDAVAVCVLVLEDERVGAGRLNPLEALAHGERAAYDDRERGGPAGGRGVRGGRDGDRLGARALGRSGERGDVAVECRDDGDAVSLGDRLAEAAHGA